MEERASGSMRNMEAAICLNSKSGMRKIVGSQLGSTLLILAGLMPAARMTVTASSIKPAKQRRKTCWDNSALSGKPESELIALFRFKINLPHWIWVKSLLGCRGNPALANKADQVSNSGAASSTKSPSVAR